MVNQISAAVITKNEEQNIARCLKSLEGAVDEIIILDSLSTDKTIEIAKSFNAKIISQNFLGYIEQKNKAIEYCQFDYILSIDADEELTPQLREAIKELKKNKMVHAYQFHRRNFYIGKKIRFCGWYPDRRIRLFDKNWGQWGGENPHDQVIMKNEAIISALPLDINHYSFNSIGEHKNQAQHFSTIAATVAYNQGRKASIIKDLIGNPIYTFFYKYFIKLGLLDGYYGLVICTLSAYSNFLKYSKLKRLYEKN